jgi:nucleotide-binding universal stress UspA family protein
MDFERVLVPLDGSSFAEAALDKAAALSSRERTSLMLLRAAEAHVLPTGDAVEAQVTVVREAEEYLAGVAARLARDGFKKVETSVWYGAPATAIVEAAAFQKPDLIVMSTHGRSGVGRLILGSVAESVLRGTNTPILLVRAAGAPVEPPSGQATTPTAAGQATRTNPKGEAHR